MIQCNRCHLQYIGETKRLLKNHFNEHRRILDIANTKSKPDYSRRTFPLLSPQVTQALCFDLGSL